MSKCNPVAVAEIVGREFIESQIPSRDSLKTRGIVDNIEIINQTSKNVEDSLERIKELHGPYTGPSSEIISFTKNLFGVNPNFRQSILEIESSLVGINNIVRAVNRIGDISDGVTFQDLSTYLLRGYLRNVRILLPDKVSNAINESIDQLPFFSEISEALGSIYSNIIIPDNAINMVDCIIGNVLEETGLSNILGQHTWTRLLPEYALNFHDNVRLLQRMGSRVLPRCTYGKIFHIMDEPLAHLYNLAQDAFGFLDVLNNRKFYLNILFQQYGDLVRLVNNLYPLCHEYVAPNGPIFIKIGQEMEKVDILGNKVRKTENNETNTTKPPIISAETISSLVG